MKKGWEGVRGVIARNAWTRRMAWVGGCAGGCVVVWMEVSIKGNGIRLYCFGIR